MNLSIILTYRCNSRCSMCHIWQHPTLPAEEMTPATLARLPSGLDRILITGGEPTLRRDLEEVVDILLPKARRLVISTNGLQADKLERIARAHPDVAFRISMDGLGLKNDTLRGERNGFARKQETLRRLATAGTRQVGLATVVQDENCDQVFELHQRAKSIGGEVAVAALHNGFQFHKIDNEPANRIRTARAIQPLLAEWLGSRRPGDWFRAALHLGLIRKILGQPRRQPCPAGRDFAVLDPWGRLYACPIRPDLEMGDLSKQTWRQILRGPGTAQARTRVRRCTHNCCLEDHIDSAARRFRFPGLSRWQALRWILAGKLRSALRRPIDFDQAVDFRDVAHSSVARRRESWLGKPFRPAFQHQTDQPYGKYNNVMNK